MPCRATEGAVHIEHAVFVCGCLFADEEKTDVGIVEDLFFESSQSDANKTTEALHQWGGTLE